MSIPHLVLMKRECTRDCINKIVPYLLTNSKAETVVLLAKVASSVETVQLRSVDFLDTGAISLVSAELAEAEASCLYAVWSSFRMFGLLPVEPQTAFSKSRHTVQVTLYLFTSYQARTQE